MGNIYLIFKQLLMYHSGTPWSRISCFISSVRSLGAFPFRVISMILKASLGSILYWMYRVVIMLSRVPMTLEMVQVPVVIRSLALPTQTSVPWERPEIWSRSEKFLGFASISIPRTKLVPISGRARVPVSILMSERSTPSSAGQVKRL